MRIQNSLWQICKNVGVNDPGVFPLAIDRFVVKMYADEVTDSQLFEIIAEMKKVDSVISVSAGGNPIGSLSMIDAKGNHKLELIVTTA